MEPEKLTRPMRPARKKPHLLQILVMRERKKEEKKLLLDLLRTRMKKTKSLK